MSLLPFLTHVCHFDKMGLCDQPWRPVNSQSKMSIFVQIRKLCELHFVLIRKLFEQDFIFQWKCIYCLNIYLWLIISWANTNNFIKNNLNSYKFEQKSYIDIKMTSIYQKQLHFNSFLTKKKEHNQKQLVKN